MGRPSNHRLRADAVPLLTRRLTSSTSIVSVVQEDARAPEQNKRSPSDFLKAVLGRPVNVRLNSGTDYRGETEPTPSDVRRADASTSRSRIF